MTINKRRMIFPTIVMLLFFICSSESLIVGTNSSEIAWAIYTKIHYVIFLLLCLRLMSGTPIKTKLLYPLLAVIFFVAINYVVAYGSNRLSTYLHIGTVIINAWLIVAQFSFDKFSKVFEKAIFLMAVYSLIVYIIALIAPQIIRSLPVIENIAGNQYYCAGLAILSKNGLDSETLFRSFGVFREPGMYQIFLNISFCIYLFYQKGSDILKIVIYILAILSTVSTTGIIAMLLIFAIFVIAINVKRKWLIVALLLSAIVLLYWLTSTHDVFLNAIEKMGNEDDTSRVARFYSFNANLKIWLAHPIFGSGMGVNSEMFPQIIMDATNAEVGDNTNTYMYILSCFGLIPFSVFIHGLYRAAKKIIQKYAFLLFLVFLVLLAGENFLYSSFAWIFAFYGFSTNKREHRDKTITAGSME